MGSDELQNFGVAGGTLPLGFFVSVADTGLKVERNQQLWKC
jgi:hypothetical protein